MGISGAVFGSVISYFVFTLIPYFFIIRKMMANNDFSLKVQII
jgi:hypothetical protein